MESFNVKVDLVQSLYEDRWIMNMADDLIKFDTTIRGRLGADYFISTVKSMSYECVVIEWE